ncbi:MAG: hypothetical protein A2600_12800 [Candidatus Lambdaproteobacteria bacterium RIFOXYD1_FULL_56_27]|uniref:Uncharacterized protein n=1 Tax=Candidatus Lambdaproteobacteria bacterium RIFOXYD2_FULL_56_26 TaxID=1817773 RepID=A0A1F6H2A3_9PROT|nr:MAG: hypothetical protein A2426_00260 [Candidatus Lambdaproteobacteria bacterium RIFOXYC1_FULL_56_13]OGH04507.1 MAG: hypothetical protein A2557_02120 [Candidatus Lambdaproteobacteria bacterium RIFOXYD2_FULL_56_26]OGH08340.1 MAG: hypothetical protein A2600_12800 [Candidatus Lambdaproteobacteria bacterium RIFOXYD1_FULL_56_27]
MKPWILFLLLLSLAACQAAGPVEPVDLHQASPQVWRGATVDQKKNVAQDWASSWLKYKGKKPGPSELASLANSLLYCVNLRLPHSPEPVHQLAAACLVELR